MIEDTYEAKLSIVVKEFTFVRNYVSHLLYGFLLILWFPLVGGRFSLVKTSYEVVFISKSFIVAKKIAEERPDYTWNTSNQPQYFIKRD